MKRILGIDLGVASIGWNLLEKDDENGQLIKSGARIFQSNQQRADAAPGESAKSDRGTKRSVRRQRDRRTRRKQKLYNLLYRNGLAPKRELWNEWIAQNPYKLRAKALGEKLTLIEFGRALYHLNQHRGYKSNRKDGDDKDGAVSNGISKVERLMKEYEAKTYGEYAFKIIDNHFREHKKPIDDDWRIRDNYTHRQMFIVEFFKIWDSQSKFYPVLLSEGLRKEVYDTIFHQRKIKSQAHLIGKCPLEKNKKRIPKAHLLFQEFRIQKNLNNLALADENGFAIALTPEDKQAMFELLMNKERVSFSALKKLLIKRGSISNSNVIFNLEKGGRKELEGNRTAHKLANEKAFGDEWNTLNRDLQDYIVYILIHFESPEKVKEMALAKWNRTEDQAEFISHLVLEKGYAGFSEKAIKTLLPFLQEGKEESTAIKEAGYELFAQKQGAHHKLPMPPDIKNAVVYHALVELRKVINGIIREYGMPDIIRVELTRDIKAGYDHRQKMTKGMRDFEARNKKARKELQKAPFNRSEPTYNDILWYNLWEECKRICPYTERSIPAEAFNSGEFQVEHIIPFSRSLDNSFSNKTLCEADFNRKKGNRTPWECVGSLISEDELLQRKRRLPWNKQRKFIQKTTDENTFLNRQLSDTRYISREASVYLKQLACEHVEVVKGQTTALLRHVWGLNGVLNKENEEMKSREDHRHHAVDAIIVALTSRSILKRLSDENKKLSAAEWKTIEEGGKEIYSTLKNRIDGRLWLSHPWSSFRHDVERSINDITVSHRVNRKVSGALHEETFYGPTNDPAPKNKKIMVVRKPVHQLSKKDLTLIRDQGIREIVNTEVQHRIEQGASLDVVMKSFESDPPYIISERAKVPIRRVRLLMEKKPSIMHAFEGSEKKVFKHALFGNNHHIAIYETLDNKGEKKQVGFVVPMMEVARRVNDGEPMVDRKYRPHDHTFLFSLAMNDMIINHEDEEIYRLQFIESSGKMTFRKHTIAGKKSTDPGILRKMAGTIHATKIKISPIGEIFPAND